MNQLELEKLKDWFKEKYDWECYKKAQAEFNGSHTWWRTTWGRTTWGFKEEDRLWLIKRSKEILESKWKEKGGEGNLF